LPAHRGRDQHKAEPGYSGSDESTPGHARQAVQKSAERREFLFGQACQEAFDRGLGCGRPAPALDTVAGRDSRLIRVIFSELIERVVPVPPGGTLADYVPFYFTPKSPMLMNIHTGYGGVQRRTNDEIVILVTAIPTLIAQGISFLFTDRHAYTGLARFSADPGELPTMIDWDILRRHDFARSDDYPDKMERYQAEALVHRHLPAAALRGIACNSATTQRRVETIVQDSGLTLRIATRKGWYFP
jgi:hypothetical protein